MNMIDTKVHLFDEELGEVMMADGRVVPVPKEVMNIRGRHPLVDTVKLWAIRSKLILPSEDIASLGLTSAVA